MSSDALIARLDASLKAVLLQIGLLLRFHTDVANLGVSDFVAHAPASLTAPLTKEIAMYNAICDKIEKEILRARAVIERDIRKLEGTTPLPATPVASQAKTEATTPGLFAPVLPPLAPVQPPTTVDLSNLDPQALLASSFDDTAAASSHQSDQIMQDTFLGIKLPEMQQPVSLGNNPFVPSLDTEMLGTNLDLDSLLASFSTSPNSTSNTIDTSMQNGLTDLTDMEAIFASFAQQNPASSAAGNSNMINPLTLNGQPNSSWQQTFGANSNAIPNPSFNVADLDMDAFLKSFPDQ